MTKLGTFLMAVLFIFSNINLKAQDEARAFINPSNFPGKLERTLSFDRGLVYLAQSKGYITNYHDFGVGHLELGFINQDNENRLRSISGVFNQVVLDTILGNRLEIIGINDNFLRLSSFEGNGFINNKTIQIPNVNDAIYQNQSTLIFSFKEQNAIVYYDLETGISNEIDLDNEIKFIKSNSGIYGYSETKEGNKIYKFSEAQEVILIHESQNSIIDFDVNEDVLTIVEDQRVLRLDLITSDTINSILVPESIGIIVDYINFKDIGYFILENELGTYLMTHDGSGFEDFGLTINAPIIMSELIVYDNAVFMTGNAQIFNDSERACFIDITTPEDTYKTIDLRLNCLEFKSEVSTYTIPGSMGVTVDVGFVVFEFDVENLSGDTIYNFSLTSSHVPGLPEERGYVDMRFNEIILPFETKSITKRYPFDYPTNPDLVFDVYRITSANNLFDPDYSNNFTEVNCTITSTDLEDSKINVSLFPNPATNYIELQTEGIDEAFQIEIFNSRGESMLDQSEIILTMDTKNTFDIVDFPTGVYFFSLQTETGKTYNTKFVKI